MRTAEMQTSAESRTCALLDGVHQALVTGDYARLPALTTALTAEMSALQDNALQREALEAVARRARRNELCLLAAQRGIRAAQRRLSDIRTSGSSLVTYDQKGRRAEVVAGRDLARKL